MKLFMFYYLQHAMNEYPHGFWWLDASVRWTRSDLMHVYKPIEDGQVAPMILVDNTDVSIFSTTHPGL
jgi:hypothetical protein